MIDREQGSKNREPDAGGHSGVENAEHDALMRLIDAMFAEINNYRKRQLTDFRNAVIAIALVTWGAYTLEKTPGNDASFIMYMAGVACFLLAVLGSVTILMYDTRVHYLLRNANDLADALSSRDGLGEIAKRGMFKPKEREAAGWRERWHMAWIYAVAIIALGVVGAVLNIERQ